MLAVVCTAIAFLVFFALITEIGPVRATVITYVNPAVAAVLGVVVLDEDFTVGMASASCSSSPARSSRREPGRTREVAPPTVLEPGGRPIA